MKKSENPGDPPLFCSLDPEVPCWYAFSFYPSEFPYVCFMYNAHVILVLLRERNREKCIYFFPEVKVQSFNYKEEYLKHTK